MDMMIMGVTDITLGNIEVWSVDSIKEEGNKKANLIRKKGKRRQQKKKVKSRYYCRYIKSIGLNCKGCRKLYPSF